jgi:hypothetical protein
VSLEAFEANLRKLRADSNRDTFDVIKYAAQQTRMLFEFCFRRRELPAVFQLHRIVSSDRYFAVVVVGEAMIEVFQQAQKFPLETGSLRNTSNALESSHLRPDHSHCPRLQQTFLPSVARIRPFETLPPVHSQTKSIPRIKIQSEGSSKSSLCT